LEQYRHATYAPEPYYEEALRRDPGDSRCNNAMGLLLYRRGKFAEAEPYFRRAIERLTSRNPNPYDGEPFYNLGLSLKMQGRFDEAFDVFYKATWNAAWQAAAFFELARLAARARRLEEALELTEHSLARNNRFHKARHLKAALLRHLEKRDAALALVEESLSLDSMEYGSLWEQYLMVDDPAFAQITHLNTDTLIELALDYAHAGLFDDAVMLLESATENRPMLKYTLGWIYEQDGKAKGTREAFHEAADLPPDYCFPNRLEDVLSLTSAMRLITNDARAPYYLGNFWYAHRQYAEAIAAWEQARQLDGQFATVHRNLGLAYFNKLSDTQRALENLETAFALDRSDARVLFELDQLYKRLNRTPAERLAFLEKHENLVDQRDDLTIERITLLNLLLRPYDALELLMNRNFHPWEGGEGKVARQYVVSLVAIARECIDHGKFEKAIQYLEQAKVFPHTLGEGKLYGTQENNIFYYLGCAYEGLGQIDKAQEWYARAAIGLSELTSPIFYNDQPPDMIFYQGLARQKLGESAEALSIFHKLVNYGRAHMDDEVKIDYFAISLPNFLVFEEDLNQRNQTHCHYMMALGYTGLGKQGTAQAHFDKVLQLDSNHLDAMLQRQLLQQK
jgi:tetratricopeptide (TPR) repeat protein